MAQEANLAKQADDLFGDFDEGQMIDNNSQLNEAGISRIDKALGDLDDGFGEFHETENDEEGAQTKTLKSLVSTNQPRNYDVFEELAAQPAPELSPQILTDSVLEPTDRQYKATLEEQSDLFENSDLPAASNQRQLHNPTIHIIAEDSVTGASMMKDIKQLDDLLGVEVSKPEDLQNILQHSNISAQNLERQASSSPTKVNESKTLIDLLGGPTTNNPNGDVEDEDDEFGDEIEVSDPQVAPPDFSGLQTESMNAHELPHSSPLLPPNNVTSQNDTLNLTAPFNQPMKLEPQRIPEEIDEEFGDELEAGRLEDSTQQIQSMSGLGLEPERILSDLQESRHLGISIIKSSQKPDLLADTSHNEPFDLKGFEEKPMSTKVGDLLDSGASPQKAVGTSDYEDLLGTNIPTTTQGNDDLHQSVEHQRDQLMSLLNTQNPAPILLHPRDENQSMDLGDPFGSFLGASVAPDGPPLNTDILAQLNGAEGRNERLLEEIREEPSLRSDDDKTRQDRLNQALEDEFGEEIEEQTIDLGNPVLGNLSQMKRDDLGLAEEPSGNFDDLSPSVYSSKKKRAQINADLASESEKNLQIRVDPAMIEFSGISPQQSTQNNILDQEVDLQIPRDSAASEPNIFNHHSSPSPNPEPNRYPGDDEEDLFDDFQEPEQEPAVFEEEDLKGQTDQKGEDDNSSPSDPKQELPLESDRPDLRDIDFVEVQKNVGEMIEVSDRPQTEQSDSLPADKMENLDSEISPRQKSSSSPRTVESDDIEIKEQRIELMTESGQDFGSPRDTGDHPIQTSRSVQPTKPVITVQASHDEQDDDLFADEVEAEPGDTEATHEQPSRPEEPPKEHNLESSGQKDKSVNHTGHHMLRPTHLPPHAVHQETPIKTADLQSVDGLHVEDTERPADIIDGSPNKTVEVEEDLFGDGEFQEAPVSVELSAQEIQSKPEPELSSTKKSANGAEDEEEDLFGEEVDAAEASPDVPAKIEPKLREHPENQSNQNQSAKSGFLFDANQVDSIIELCENFQKSLQKPEKTGAAKRSWKSGNLAGAGRTSKDQAAHHSRIFGGQVQPCADHFEWLGRMKTNLSTARGPLSAEDRLNYHLHRKLLLGFFQESVFNKSSIDPSTSTPAVPLVKGFAGADVAAANTRIKEDKDRLLSDIFVKGLEDYTHLFSNA